jgi:hypothetical protein
MTRTRQSLTHKFTTQMPGGNYLINNLILLVIKISLADDRIH